jgi:nucleotide-binding universal stress UspA family protein
VTEATRILCAIDSSQPSTAAFHHALAAAKSRNAELHVVCAVPATRSFNWRARDRTAHLAELRRIATAAGVQVKVSVQHGEPAGVILLHANSSNSRVPDLIVLGTHGRRGVDRLCFGSVAERVMHRASCPTLVVPNSAGEAADGLVPPLDRILCAVDFSPASLAAFEHARHGASGRVRVETAICRQCGHAFCAPIRVRVCERGLFASTCEKRIVASSLLARRSS